MAGLWPCWSGDKKNRGSRGHRASTAWPSRGWPGSKLRRKSKKHKWSAWPGQGPGSKLAKPGKEKQKSLPYNWPALAAVGGDKNWSSLPRNLDQPGQDHNHRAYILVQSLP